MGRDFKGDCTFACRRYFLIVLRKKSYEGTRRTQAYGGSVYSGRQVVGQLKHFFDGPAKASALEMACSVR